MNKMKLDIQLFSQTILTKAKGGSSPSIYYTITVDYANRTANSIDLTFTIKQTCGVDSSSKWGSPYNNLKEYFVLNGTTTGEITSHTAYWSYSGSPYTSTLTYTLSGLTPTQTSIPNVEFIAYRTAGGSTGPIDTWCSDITIPTGELPIRLNGTGGIGSVVFNGTTITALYYNGTQIF